MPYLPCSEDLAYVGRLLDLFATLLNSPTLSDDFEGFMVLELSCEKQPFLRKLLKWGRACDQERQIKTTPQPVFAGFPNVNISAVLTARRPFVHALVSQWWSGYECCRELDIPLSPILAYLSHHTVAAAGLSEAVWKFALFVFFVLVLPSFSPCARESSPADQAGDPQISYGRFRVVTFSLSSSVPETVTDDVFLRLFEDSPLDLVTAFFAFKCSQRSMVQCFVPRVVPVNIHRGNGCSDWLFFVAGSKAWVGGKRAFAEGASRSCPLLMREEYFQDEDAAAAVACFAGEVSSPKRTIWRYPRACLNCSSRLTRRPIGIYVISVPGVNPYGIPSWRKNWKNVKTPAIMLRLLFSQPSLILSTSLVRMLQIAEQGAPVSAAPSGQCWPALRSARIFSCCLRANTTQTGAWYFARPLQPAFNWACSKYLVALSFGGEAPIFSW